jgi:hypothetical protein
MSQLNNFCSDNPIIYGMINILFGGLISFFITRYYTHKKKLSFIVSSSPIISDKKASMIDGLEIIFKKEKIKNASMSTITFTNSGNKNIDYQKDFIKNCGIKISFTEPNIILTTKILDVSDSSIQPKIIENNDKVIKISFENMEPKTEFKVQIIHTGDGFKDFDISGRIKGGKFNCTYGW